MRLLLDTNILIDYYGRREPFVDAWRQLRIMQLFGDAELWVSAKSFTDVFYVLARAVGAENLQNAFVKSFEFLNVCPISGADVQEAAKRAWPDFEDCLIDVAARSVRADAIITRDARGFARSDIPCYTLPEFFAWLKREHGLEYGEAEWE